jgi:hypothetical protein
MGVRSAADSVRAPFLAEQGEAVSKGPLSGVEPPVKKCWGCLDCCSTFCSKIAQVFSKCRTSKSTQVSAMGSPVSLSQAQIARGSHPTCATKCKNTFFRVLDNRYVIGSSIVVSTGGLITSSVLISPIYTAYSYACAAELSGFSGDLRTCQKPYEDNIVFYQSFIASSCFLLGWLLQKFWERDISVAPKDNETPVLAPAVERSTMHKLKRLIGTIQDNYSYEISISLGYLYDGVWINTRTPVSWIAYFNCHAAAIGAATASLGMYLRTVWVLAREYFEQQAGRVGQQNASSNVTRITLRNNCILLTSSGVAIVAIGVSSSNLFPADLFPAEAAKIVREISVMLVARPIGKLGTDWISNLKHKYNKGWEKNAALVLNTATKFSPSALVLAAYLAYYNSATSDVTQLTGMAIMGLALGMRESGYLPLQIKINQKEKNRISLADNASCPIIVKVKDLVISHWKTLALIGFWITSAELSLVECYDYKTYICPISFELSSNYIQIDQIGMNILLTIGLTHYYARKLFRIAQTVPSNYVQKVSKCYLQLFDKYQYGIISLIPYVMVKSGNYTPEYNVYACFNPPAVVAFVAVSFGTYKDNIDIGANDPTRPAFTDKSIATRALIVIT